MSVDVHDLGRRVAGLRRAAESGEPLDPVALSDLAERIEACLQPRTDAAPGRPDLLALLDEADALRAVLVRQSGALRAAIDADDRRRHGRAAYRLATSR